MPCRVEEDPEAAAVARLMLVSGGAHPHHDGLGAVQIVDLDVQVHLLGHLLPRPLRCTVAGDLLEGDAVSLTAADIGPCAVLVDVNLPPEQLPVEPGEHTRIRTVHDE